MGIVKSSKKKTKVIIFLRSEKKSHESCRYHSEKRDGIELSKDEIHWLIEGYVAGTVPDYQMAALCHGGLFQGMTTREI